jgi:hypothetical protein
MPEHNMHAEFWWAKVEKDDLLKDLGVDGRVILKWNKEIW